MPKLEDSLKGYIDKVGEDLNLDPDEIRAIIDQESNWNPKAGSSAGAKGLMQLMPATARELDLKVDLAKGIDERTDPYKNIKAGATYYKKMLDRYEGNQDLARAAYNAGPGNVDKAGRNVPRIKETQDYVTKVADYYGKRKGVQITDTGIVNYPSGESPFTETSYQKKSPSILDFLIAPAEAKTPSNDFYKKYETLGDSNKASTSTSSNDFYKKYESLDATRQASLGQSTNSAGGVGGSLPSYNPSSDRVNIPGEEMAKDLGTNLIKGAGEVSKIGGEGLGKAATDFASEVVARTTEGAATIPNIAALVYNDLNDFIPSAIPGTELKDWNLIDPNGWKIPGTGKTVGDFANERRADFGAGNFITEGGKQIAISRAMAPFLPVLQRAPILAALFAANDVSNQALRTQRRTGNPVGLKDVIPNLNLAEVGATAIGAGTGEVLGDTIPALGAAIKSKGGLPVAARSTGNVLKAATKAFTETLNTLPVSDAIKVEANAIARREAMKDEAPGTVGALRAHIGQKIKDKELILKDTVSKEAFERKGVSGGKEAQVFFANKMADYKAAIKAGDSALVEQISQEIGHYSKEIGLDDIGAKQITNTFKTVGSDLGGLKALDDHLSIAGLQDDAARTTLLLSRGQRNLLETGKAAPHDAALLPSGQAAPKKVDPNLVSYKESDPKKLLKSLSKLRPDKTLIEGDPESLVVQTAKARYLEVQDLLQQEINGQEVTGAVNAMPGAIQTPISDTKRLGLMEVQKHLSDLTDEVVNNPGKFSKETLTEVSDHLASMGEKIKSLSQKDYNFPVEGMEKVSGDLLKKLDYIKQIGEAEGLGSTYAKGLEDPAEYTSFVQNAFKRMKSLYEAAKEGKILENAKNAAYKAAYDFTEDPLVGLSPREAVRWVEHTGKKGATQLADVLDNYQALIKGEDIAYKAPLVRAFKEAGLMQNSKSSQMLFRIANIVPMEEFTNPQRLAWYKENPKRLISEYASNMQKFKKDLGEDTVNALIKEMNDFAPDINPKMVDYLGKGQSIANKFGYRQDGIRPKEMLNSYVSNQRELFNLQSEMLNPETIAKAEKFLDLPKGTLNAETPKFYLEERVLNPKGELIEDYHAATMARIEQSIRNRAADKFLNWAIDNAGQLEDPQLKAIIYSAIKQVAGGSPHAGISAAAKAFETGFGDFTKAKLNTASFTLLDLTQMTYPTAELLTSQKGIKGLLSLASDEASFNNALKVFDDWGLLDNAVRQKQAITGGREWANNKGLRASLGKLLADNFEKMPQGGRRFFERIMDHPFINEPEKLLRASTALMALSKEFGEELPAVIQILQKDTSSSIFQRAQRAVHSDISKFLFTGEEIGSIFSNKPLIGSAFRLSTTARKSLGLAYNLAKTNPNAFSNLLGLVYATGGSQAAIPFINTINWISRRTTKKDLIDGGSFEEADKLAREGRLPGGASILGLSQNVLDTGTGPRQNIDIAGFYPIQQMIARNVDKFNSGRMNWGDAAAFALDVASKGSLGLSPSGWKDIIDFNFPSKGGDKLSPSLAQKDINNVLVFSSKGVSREIPVAGWDKKIASALKVGRTPLIMRRYADQLDTVSERAYEYHRQEVENRIARTIGEGEPNEKSSVSDSLLRYKNERLQTLETFASEMQPFKGGVAKTRGEFNSGENFNKATLSGLNTDLDGVFEQAGKKARGDYRDSWKDKRVQLLTELQNQNLSNSKRMEYETELRKANKILAILNSNVDTGKKAGF